MTNNSIARLMACKSSYLTDKYLYFVCNSVSKGTPMPRFKMSCLILCLCFCQTTKAEVKTLKANDSNDPNGPYTVAMIKLALEHMDTKYNLVVGKENFTQARANEEVKTGGLDLIWTTTGKEIEQE
jgi:hypothetical protein